MNSFDITTLDNGIKVITKVSPNTPRTAINLFMDSGVKYECKAGLASLAGRLLLQGTETRSSKAIAEDLDSDAIEMDIDTQKDYTKIKSVFLNEDYNKALDILVDVVKYSNFNELEKEKRKFKGEVEMELDSPRVKALDNFIKNFFPEHPYGNSHTKIMEELSGINKDVIRDYYNLSIRPEKFNIVVVGNINKDKVIKSLKSRFEDVKSTDLQPNFKEPLPISENKIVTITKNDAAQAQIIQGWNAADVSNDDFSTLSILNSILGSSGLSSRLFVELRDKKGLAYTVRSSYEPLKHSGVFSVYIATAPNNIRTCLDGFNVEIKKLQDELVSEKELEDAKSNYLGKRAFFHETNSQQAHYLGYYDIIGLGAEYDEKIKDKIKKVTAQDIREAANRYLSRSSIISILAPEKYLINF